MGYLKKSLKMRNPENTAELTLEQAIAPVVQCHINFRNQRMLLHQMFVLSVANAPDNETDNFTANQLSPFYLAMCELLENLDSIHEVHADNIVFCMDNLTNH
jgi:hypothetical protein